MIKVENLTKRYAGQTAIRDLNFEVGQGEIMGFLGPNGAGKTTTMRILAGFMPATSGRASIAGFEPGPMVAVYHATKAFVLSFSESLATELQGTGVTLTALCPGATDTDFFPKADMVDTTVFQKGTVMAPQPVAEAGYEALMDGDPIIVPGGMNKTLVFARRFLSETAQAKLNKKFYEKVPAEDQKRERGDLETAEAQKR